MPGQHNPACFSVFPPDMINANEGDAMEQKKQTEKGSHLFMCALLIILFPLFPQLNCLPKTFPLLRTKHWISFFGGKNKKIRSPPKYKRIPLVTRKKLEDQIVCILFFYISYLIFFLEAEKRESAKMTK